VKDIQVVLQLPGSYCCQSTNFLRFNVGLQAFTVLSILNVMKDSQIVSKQAAIGVTNGVSDYIIEKSIEKGPYDTALRNARLHGVRTGTKDA